MVNDVAVLPRAGHPLPPDLHRQLAAAFALELDARLPRLLAAAERLRRRGCQASAATLKVIVAEVHTLSSSAVVVAAHDAARAARACEHRLLAYVDGAPLTPGVVAEALEHVDALVAALTRWRPGDRAGVA